MNRRISVNTTGFAVPQSFITKSKQRLKQQIDTVYLNDGDEFEIELYNPTQNKVLAKIEMNGNSIGNGIILRPGERIFLERYLDEAKKFLFDTYVVNGNNEEVKQAIANNGDVVIKFYDEVKIPTYNVNSGTVTINNPNFGWGSTTTGSPWYGNSTFTTSGTNMIYNSTLTSGTVNTLHLLITLTIHRDKLKLVEWKKVPILTNHLRMIVHRLIVTHLQLIGGKLNLNQPKL